MAQEDNKPSKVGDDDNEEMEVENDDTEESEDNSDVDESEEESDNDQTRKVYLPNDETEKDIQLDYDESSYICYHSVKTGSPCLSFDIIPDKLGDNHESSYPLTMTVVGGTQVSKVHANHLLVMKLSNMHRNKETKEDDEESESESENEEDEENKPVLETAQIRHSGCVNRVKVTTMGDETIAASWSELGKVHIWNLSRPLNAVNDSRVMAAYIQNKENPQPIFTFGGHTIEGYALNWSPLIPGTLITGDNKNNIHLWKPLEGGTWHVDQRPLVSHTDSVEDLQWSPNENSVFASCSVDKSIRIWDTRSSFSAGSMLAKNDAHDADINVISWNKSDPFILSGGDDGKLRIWDLRQFPGSSPICTFKHHTGPITSVEWHPTDRSVFAASSTDNQLTQWDLAIEPDEDEESGEQSVAEQALPQQLLFMHMGQKEIKELHWHPQMPGVVVSTGENGLDIFRTISV